MIGINHQAAFLLIAMVIGALPARGQEDFLVAFRDGTVIRTPLTMSKLPWRRVDQQGKLIAEELQLDNVVKMELALTPASHQLLMIRKHLADLQSDNYHARNEAEAGLVKWGGQFIDVLTAARESPNAEVRYRVGRVLKRLQGKDAKRVDADFDLVTLANGEIVAGDMELEALDLQFQNQTFRIRRDEIHWIERVVTAPEKANDSWVNGASAAPADRFYQRSDVHINFDQGRLNETFAKFEPIPRAYVFRGAKLMADCGEEPATIVTAGFAVDQGRSRKNSAATMMDRNTRKYLGAIQVDFCQPGLEDIPAAVHRVGCYIALVDHPRDFVLNAYSAEHHLVATSEALEKTSFLGVESSIPIAYVRVQPNRNLKVDISEQDDNFVIDDLTFDRPQPLCRSVSSHAIATLRDQSRILCESIRFDPESSSFIAVPIGSLKSHANELIVPLRDLASLSLPAGEALSSDSRAGAVWGYFRDGTQLPLDVSSNPWTVSGHPEWTVSREDLSGIWGGIGPLRFPYDEDLATGKTVIVNPAERWLVANVQVEAGQISWEAEGAELREPIELKNSTHEPDTRSEFIAAEAPSIWWHKPVDVQPGAGWVRLKDGRKFAIDGDSPIALSSVDADAIVLQRGPIEIRVPWDEIDALTLPGGE
jgi:hypothetical protein